jgi:hypothetical protein
MEANISPNFYPQKFICELCHYNTSNKKDYNKHLLTAKHTRLKTANELLIISPNYQVEKEDKSSHDVQCYFCECGKKYRHMSSLCKHKKKCYESKISDHYNMLVMEAMGGSGNNYDENTKK